MCKVCEYCEIELNEDELEFDDIKGEAVCMECTYEYFDWCDNCGEYHGKDEFETMYHMEEEAGEQWDKQFCDSCCEKLNIGGV